MRLPADRTGFEWVLRAIAALALAWLVVGAFLDRNTPGGLRIDYADLPASLVDWTASPPADTMGLRIPCGLDRSTLDYLRALRAGGTSITWANEGLLPIMLETEPLQDPAGGAVVRIAAPAHTILSLSDSLGVLDTIRTDQLGRTVRLPGFSGKVAVTTGSTVASAQPHSADPVRSVVVLGLAGWESKFAIRALEERGWKVESRVGIAPGLGTVRGRPFPLDTARHATVIALDSSAAGYVREIQRFVRSGGGLVVGPGAKSLFARPPFADVTIRNRRDGPVTLAAWRAGSGRMIQTDQGESWRWRMAEGEDAVLDHRDWWAGLVGAVASRPAAGAQPTNPAPLATLTQDLGPPSSLPANESEKPTWPLALAVLLVSLFTEWLSRRLRGAA